MYGYIPLGLIMSPADPSDSAGLFPGARPPFANSLDFVFAKLWPRLRPARRAAPQPEPTPCPGSRCEPQPAAAR